jgi:predicted nucleic acid-binding protein
MPDLVDTSVWARKQHPLVKPWLDQCLLGGAAATCDMVKLELLYSTRNAAEFEALEDELSALHSCPIGAAEWQRAIDVYRSLARQGGAHQRSVKHADLLIAAAAESAGARIVHYDEDFDRISKVTGQPSHWVAARGTL